jgi:tripartite-type tricarboxylate transporter receptor subunit TctC
VSVGARVLLILALAAVAPAATAQAARWPGKSVRVIVPFAAGGSTGQRVIARGIAKFTKVGQAENVTAH